MLIVDDLLLLPFKGLFGILRRIQEMAEHELSGEDYLVEKLMELRLKFELDEISEEDYDEQEKELMARLKAVAEGENEEEVRE